MRTAMIKATLGIFLASCTGTRPENLGLEQGRFTPCPDKPNCVSSFEQKSDDEHYIDPLNSKGSSSELQSKVIKILKKQPRAEVVTVNDNYIHAEFTSLIMRYVDDIEFFFPPEGNLIHIRSASRIGHSDLGVNRKRVEMIRSAINSTQAVAP